MIQEASLTVAATNEFYAEDGLKNTDEGVWVAKPQTSESTSFSTNYSIEGGEVRFSVAGTNAKGFEQAKAKGLTFVGADGKERFELDASKASLMSWPMTEGKTFRLDELVSFPELYDNYNIGHIKVTKRSSNKDYGKGFRAGYGSLSSPIFDEDGVVDPDPKSEIIEIFSDLSETETLGLILHEVQHGIQAREGFLKGSSKQGRA